MIPDSYIDATCKLGQGEECCAFLVAGMQGLECAKDTEFEDIIRARVASGQFTAKGDNCPGWSKVVSTLS